MNTFEGFWIALQWTQRDIISVVANKCFLIKVGNVFLKMLIKRGARIDPWDTLKCIILHLSTALSTVTLW